MTDPITPSDAARDAVDFGYFKPLSRISAIKLALLGLVCRVWDHDWEDIPQCGETVCRRCLSPMRDNERGLFLKARLDDWRAGRILLRRKATP